MFAIIQRLGVFAWADRFGVHLRIALGSEAKYFIPPEVLASLFIVCSPRWSIAVLQWYFSGPCTDSPLSCISSLHPGWVSSKFSIVLTSLGPCVENSFAYLMQTSKATTSFIHVASGKSYFSELING